MSITLNGTDGIASVDGTATKPGLRGTDTNSGIVGGANQVIVSTDGSERFRVASAGQLGIAGANYGTSGHVLTSGGASAAPSWAAAGACVHVGRTVISSGSSHEIDIEDTALFDGTYDRILLSFTGMRNATDETTVFGRLKFGGSYKSATEYAYHTRNYKANAEAVHSGTTSYNDNSNSFCFLKEAGNAAGECWALHINIYNPASTTVWKMMEWQTTWAQKDRRAYWGRGGGHYQDTSTGQGALQGFKLWTEDSGGNDNITDGIVNKYGWKIS